MTWFSNQVTDGRSNRNSLLDNALRLKITRLRVKCGIRCFRCHFSLISPRPFMASSYFSTQPAPLTRREFPPDALVPQRSGDTQTDPAGGPQIEAHSTSLKDGILGSTMRTRDYDASSKSYASPISRHSNDIR